jgi:hypothetical protein
MTEPFTLLVAGTRTFNDYPLLDAKLSAYTEGITNLVLVTGEWRSIGKFTPGWIGADLLAEHWAELNRFSYKQFPPPFDQFPGKNRNAAFHVRNREMVEYVASKPPDLRGAVLFWDGESDGTSEVRDLLKKHNVRTKTVYYKG